MRIWVIVCHSYLWALHGINGYEYCSSNKPVIHVCTNSTGSNENNVMNGVYVNTGRAPVLEENMCRCTILPTTMNTIELNIQGETKMSTVEFMIVINSVSLNDLPSLPTVKINGETELVYSTTNDFEGGFCLSIAPNSPDGIFNITCVKTKNQGNSMDTTSSDGYSTDTTSSKSHRMDTTSSNGNSTDTSTEPTNSQTQTKPLNDVSETNITLIAVIAGSFIVVAVIVVVTIAILCCKRKRKSNFTQATASHQIGNVNDGTNGGQPNAAYENCGEALQMQTSENGDHYEGLDIANIDSSSKNDYSKLHF